MAKRDPVPQCKYPLYRCYPWFFWRQCCECGREFRREHGWRAITGPIFRGVGRPRHLCNECAPDHAAAVAYFNEDRWRPPRPSTPPPAQSMPPDVIERASRSVERDYEWRVELARRNRSRYESLEVDDV